MKQIISHIEEAQGLAKCKFKELKDINNLRSENPFDFTGKFEIQKEEIEIDLGLIFE